MRTVVTEERGIEGRVRTDMGYKKKWIWGMRTAGTKGRETEEESQEHGVQGRRK